MTAETKTTIDDGLYFLHPLGCGWYAAIFRGGLLVEQTQEYLAGTHDAAGDQWAGVYPSDGDDDVEPYEADMISAAVLGHDSNDVIVQRAAETEPKRVIRPLTDEEAQRVAEARRDVEAERDEILREGRRMRDD